MFNWLKKQVTAEVYGHQMWLYCCDISETFCKNVGPHLEAAGFIHNANTNQVFAEETMMLHLWIISRSLGMNDRKVLDALHNHTHGLTNIRDRYVLYDRENEKDIEMLRKGLTPMGLAEAFLRHVGNKPTGADVIVEKAAIQLEIFDTFKLIKQKREQVKIL